MIAITLSVLSGIIIGLVQVCKKFVAKRWLPVIAIVLGVIAMFLFQMGGNIGNLILEGIALGLGSVGLFEFGKSTIAGK